MKLKSVSFIILLLFSQIISAQEKTLTWLYDAGASTQDKLIDITHLNAEIKINPFDTLVTGKVSFSFFPIRTQTDSVVFWAPDIIFSLVEIPGIDISYRKNGDNLVIYNLSKANLTTGKEFEIRMEYTSRPKYDLFFIGWNEPALRSNKQIWAHRPFHWLPYYGDRLTTDVYITFDGQYKVMTNGVRESVKDNNDGTKTWHYKMYKEHPFFSTCLVIGDYKFLEMKTSGGLV